MRREENEVEFSRIAGTRLGLIGPGDEGDRAPGPGAGDRQTAVDRDCQAAVLARRAGGSGLPLRRPTARGHRSRPRRPSCRYRSRCRRRATAAPPPQLRALTPTGPDPDSWAWVVSEPDCAGAVVSFDSIRAAASDKGGGEQGRRQDPGEEGHQESTNLPARAKTASSIGSVSLPVNVFCWLGWYEPSSAHSPTARLGTVPEASASGVGIACPSSRSARRAPSQANAPSATIVAAARRGAPARAPGRAGSRRARPASAGWPAARSGRPR